MSRGIVARIGQLRVGVWPLVRLDRFDLDAGNGLHLHADAIAATWLRRLRLAIRAATIAPPGMITVSSPASARDIERIRGGGLVLTLVEPQSGLSTADPRLRKRLASNVAKIAALVVKVADRAKGQLVRDRRNVEDALHH